MRAKKSSKLKGILANTETNNVKGHLVYWDVGEIDISRKVLEKTLSKLGPLPYPTKRSETYVDLVPRNDYKSAMLRALRKLLRGDERFYKRLRDVKDSVDFLVVLPEEIIDTVNGEYDFNLHKEMTLHLDKVTGKVYFKSKDKQVTATARKRILDLYTEMQSTIDTHLFKTVMHKLMTSQCHGVSVRSYGGIYYVTKNMLDYLDPLRDVFQAFKEHADLQEIPIYDNEATNRAIETSVAESLMCEIQTMVDEISKMSEKGELKDRVLQNRRAEIHDKLKEVKIFEKDLRKEATRIREMFESMEELVSEKLNSTKPFDLAKALKDLI